MEDWALVEEDFERIVQFAKKHDLKKVGLQFPNELVSCAVRTALALQERCPDAQFAVLADSPFGGCCLDEIAGQHYAVDGLVHLGSSCLTQVTAAVPVLFVFGRGRLDPCVLRDAVDKLMAAGPVLLFFDLVFSAAVREAFPGPQKGLIVTEADLGGESEAVRTCGRVLPGLEGTDASQLAPYHLLYVGGRGLALNTVLLTVPHCASYHVLDPAGGVQQLDRTRQLRRRFLLISKAAEASRVGLLVSARGGRARYLPAVRRLEALVRAAGKKCYVLHVGKMTPAKLQNFPNINCFVMVGCRQNCLFDIQSHEDYNLFQPVVSPFEMEQALKDSSDRCWDRIGTDLQELDLRTEQETRSVALPANNIVAERGPREVGKLPQRAVEEGHSWFGLQADIGSSPIVPPTRGRSGIAIAYEDEPK